MYQFSCIVYSFQIMVMVTTTMVIFLPPFITKIINELLIVVSAMIFRYPKIKIASF